VIKKYVSLSFERKSFDQAWKASTSTEADSTASYSTFFDD
jgi:hypothetical protein